MKFPLTKIGIAATLAAGLILAPGLSPAQASTLDSSAASSSVSKPALSPVGSLANPKIGSAGGTATTYGMWFIPCDVFGFRFC